MKILLYGNQDNGGYRLGKWLKSRGHTVKLLLPVQSKHRSLPEWEDSELINGYPDWIEKWRIKKLHYFSLPSKLLRMVSEYDLVFSRGQALVSALLLNKPVFFIPSGSDITQVPFACNSLRDEVISFLYRRRIKRVRKIIAGQNDIIWAAKLLGVNEKVVVFPGLGFVDMKKMKENLDKKLLENLNKEYKKYDTVFFLPGRKNLNPNIVDYKGVEYFLSAFKKFVEANTKNVRVIAGLHGRDSNDFKRKIFEMKLEQYFDFVEHMPLNKLHAYMAIDNVVIFNSCVEGYETNMGGIARESLGLGSLLMDSVEPGSGKFKELYNSGCFILSVFNEDDILRQMNYVKSLSLEEKNEIKQQIRAWAYKYLHWENRIEELENILLQVIEENKKA